MLRDDMFSQEHYWTSLFMIGLFTLFFFVACGIKLQGIKVAELGRSAELENWLKKQLVSQVQNEQGNHDAVKAVHLSIRRKQWEMISAAGIMF